VPAEQVRCVCQDMGGNFGTRNFFYPEYALLAWAARRVGRPVKWTCERSEAFLSDYQGRDLTVEAELALGKEGNFLAARGSNLSNLGGHAAAFVSLQKGLGLMSSVYRIPVGYFRGRGAVTNTISTTPYRSAGRPEAIFVIERLIDLAADQLGLDAVALRRRNMIPPSAQPYANPLGVTYDSGRYEDAMETALALADWNGFPARRAEARKRGKLRGIGIANYVEITSGAPRERTEITVLPEGRVELVMGTMSSGQGHETSFAQLVTEWLGDEPARCAFRGRGRHDTGACCGDQRYRRRARRVGGAPYRNAGNPGAGVARYPGSTLRCHRQPRRTLEQGLASP
jgi:carbon-monoxide dehydrogenase large subunit